jgi:hypothetical protein
MEGPMLDHDTLKRMAKTIGRPVTELMALTHHNDPFYAGMGYRAVAAEWFAKIWQQHGEAGFHLRRLHYRLVSLSGGSRVLLPSGREYQNTEKDWTYLAGASLGARYLNLVPFDGLVDQRNAEAMIFAKDLDPADRGPVSSAVAADEVEMPEIEMPVTPWVYVGGLSDTAVIQDYLVEVWIEKSTQNDWLVPLCQRRGVNLVVGIGEQSETRSRELAFRADKYSVPVRVIYISDFDPGGRSMPKAVARKAEFTIEKFGLDVDMQLIPLALTPDQIRRYRLPRKPIKDSERRKNKFERIFGVGATELDAMEALHPGELARIVNAEIDNFLDPNLEKKVAQVRREQGLAVDVIVAQIEKKHTEEIEELESDLQEIAHSLYEWTERAQELWTTMAEELEEKKPDLSAVEVPVPEVSGETDSFILFDSKRDYFTQIDCYNQWKDGEE